MKKTRTRSEAYSAHKKASLHALDMEHLHGYGSPQAKEARRQSQAAWDEYRAWVKADSHAAQAGAYASLEYEPSFNNPDY